LSTYQPITFNHYPSQTVAISGHYPVYLLSYNRQWYHLQ
jgi:hypothetical protein